MHKVLRHISLEEAEILRRTLEVGATEAIPAEPYASISKLPITAACECGCKTVWFGPNGAAATGNILAVGFAVQGGQPLEIIVWSEQEAIAGLEFVFPEPSKMQLPSPGEISGNAA